MMKQKTTSGAVCEFAPSGPALVAIARQDVGCFVLFAILAVFFVDLAHSSDFSRPWKNKNEALVLDAYERNGIDWSEVVKDRKIRAFIGKSSDGLAPPYTCKQRNEAKKVLCKKTFQNYWLKRELYQTRKIAAKNMGLKWGAYHLGRPGNPIDQANHFIDFANPKPDELIALDIEHDDPAKWISFEDAEIFARHIHSRLGRYPVLYTNHDTAKRIARQRHKYQLLSRLPLWYARYKEDIRGVFPLGNWDRYALWQFSSHLNCNKKKCLYRVKGTGRDIDVNASGLTVAEFERAWPFNELASGKPGKSKIKVAKKSTTEKRASLYAVSYTIKLGKKKKFKLNRIAVPTPAVRPEPADFVNTIDPMVVGSVSEVVDEPERLRSDMFVANRKKLLEQYHSNTIHSHHKISHRHPLAALYPARIKAKRTAEVSVNKRSFYTPVRYGYLNHETMHNELMHAGE